MPAKSIAQRRLFAAAEHGADFPLAQRIRASMDKSQMRDFAVGSEADLPERVTPKPKRRRAYGEVVKDALTAGPVGHPAANLGRYHHPRQS